MDLPGDQPENLFLERGYMSAGISKMNIDKYSSTRRLSIDAPFCWYSALCACRTSVPCEKIQSPPSFQRPSCPCSFQMVPFVERVGPKGAAAAAGGLKLHETTLSYRCLWWNEIGSTNL